MSNSSVLFLQGPLGPFFKALAKTFSEAGYTTHKINFNGGDHFYSGADYVVDYGNTPEQWSSFLREYLQKQKISAVFIMGDCRYYHRTAKSVCDELGVEFWVFEEGYLRPNTITLEQHGVNALSQLDLTPQTLRAFPKCKAQSPCIIGSNMRQRVIAAAAYYWAGRFARNQFEHYQHHRAFSPVREGYCWIRGAVRKQLVKLHDANIQRLLTTRFSGKCILVPLQVHDDSQMLYHSDYDSVEAFITEVVESFRDHACPSQALCFKHHPMDRGYTHYGKAIAKAAASAGIEDRVFYCHDVPLPTLYHHITGVVTVNSTVGMSALLHHLPTKLMGRAMYDIEGLTHQGSLDSFWQAPSPVDQDLFKHLHSYLFRKTQINGSFFKHLELTCQNTLRFFEAARKQTTDSESSDIPQAA